MRLYDNMFDYVLLSAIGICDALLGIQICRSVMKYVCSSLVCCSFVYVMCGPSSSWCMSIGPIPTHNVLEVLLFDSAQLFWNS